MSESPDYFKDLRPYNDHETAQAMVRIMKDRHFTPMATRLFPEIKREVIRDTCKTIQTSDAFQELITLPAITRMIFDSVDDYQYNGVKELDPNACHLFISNHRDIVMDAVCLQYALINEGKKTVQIAFGDNLLANRLIKDLALSNRMFKVSRGGSPRELLQNSLILSQYIRTVIHQGNNSVWIAQRNGRTKDGFDLTEPGLMKMFNLSGNGPVDQNFLELHIRPVSISYQYEPCAYLKIRETFLRKDGPYKKAKGEDLQSVLEGIQQAKGGVVLNVGAELDANQIKALLNKAGNDGIRNLSNWMDVQIVGGYHLWKTHFVAYDQLHRTQRFSDRYSSPDKTVFLDHMHSQIGRLSDLSHDNSLETLFLSVYANPIINKLRLDLNV